jgi:hypothetical protein
VVRELLRGKRTDGQLVLSPARIPTNILADRPNRLVSGGVFTRTSRAQSALKNMAIRSRLTQLFGWPSLPGATASWSNLPSGDQA